MDDNVYIKKENGRYEPIGVLFDRDWLGDGIWYVSHNEGSSSIKNMSYYSKVYKVGDAKYPDISKLAGVTEIAELVATSDAVHKMLNKDHSLGEACNVIISEAFKYAEELDRKANKRPLVSLSEYSLEKEGFSKEGECYKRKIDGTWYRVELTKIEDGTDRFYNVKVFSTWNNEKKAEFKAEYLHQIYQFIKLF